MTSPGDADDALSGTVQGAQIGDHNIQQNSFFGATNVFVGAGSDQDLQAAQRGAHRTRQNWLRVYLTAARSVARQHPYAIALPGAPPLSTVYLRQYVGYPSEQPPPPAGRAPGHRASADQLDAVASGQDPPSWQAHQHQRQRQEARADADQISQTLQRLDIADVLSRHPAGLILGGPGSGKSSLLRHLVDTAAGDWLDGGSGRFVPALIKAQSLLGSLPLHQAVGQAIRTSLGARLGAVDLDAFLSDAPVPGVPWLILVDGLDEIFDASLRQRVMDIIAGWRGGDDALYRFCITTRPIPQGELLALRSSGMPVFEIQPFTDEQLPLLAATWLSALGVAQVSTAVGQFIEQLRQTNLSLLARNPLIATIACVVYAGDPGRELPPSRADLYEEFVTLLMQKPFAQDSPAESMKAWLGGYGEAARLAAEKLISELRGFIQELAVLHMNESGLSHRAAAEQLSAAYRPAGVPAARWNQVTAELLRQSGLLTERGGDFDFSHDTIMEYLAACALATSSRLGIRERWSLIAQAGRSQSFALFRVAALLRQGTDLTRKAPVLWQVRRLLHARLVAALVHDGCALEPGVVQAAQDRLLAIATLRTSGIPAILRQGYWLEDDCVMAARSLMMLDKGRGFDLLVRLAADPSVGGLNIFDVFAERMLTADFTDIDAEQGLHILAEVALVRHDPAVGQPEDDDYRRRLIVEFIFDRDAELGTEIIGKLAEDPSTSVYERLTYVQNLAELDKPRAISVLTGIIADPGVAFPDRTYAIYYLRGLDQPSVLGTLDRLAADPRQSDFVRVMAAETLYQYSAADGASAFRNLSREQRVMGFYRTYHYAAYGRGGGQADRLAELAADPTLAGQWRIFAADELFERENDLGLAALEAIAHDPSLGWRTRARAGLHVAVYRRVLPVAVTAPGSGSAGSSSEALRALLGRLRELALVLVRGA
jgi:hypothetical protein